MSEIDLTKLPPPPVPADVDLRSFDDMPVDVARLRTADMQVEVTPEQGWYGFQLWCASWHQVPAASLPNDDAKLAFLAGLGRDLRTWKRVRSGALRGFELCSDGRLYHSVVAEKALKAWDVKRARVRGAETTNQRAKNSQGVENTQNTSRSSDRSIYNVEDDQRPDSETPSADPAGRSGGGTEQSRTEQSRVEEGKSAPPAKAGKKTRAKTPASPLSPDWKPDDKDRAYGYELNLVDNEIDFETKRFIRYWTGPNAKGRGLKSDWHATWCNWLDRCAHEIIARRPRGWVAPPRKVNGANGQHHDASPNGGMPIDTQRVMARTYFTFGTPTEDGGIGPPYRPKPKERRVWNFSYPAPGEPGCPISKEILTETANEFGAEWQG